MLTAVNDGLEGRSQSTGQRQVPDIVDSPEAPLRFDGGGAADSGLLTSELMKQVLEIARIPTLAFASLALALGAEARAEAEEWAVSVGPALMGVSETIEAESELRLFWGLQGEVRYGLDDFWQVSASVELGTSSADASVMVATLFEALYIVDIVTWVPFLSAGAGTQFRQGIPEPTGGTESSLDLILAFGGGLEYRPTRDYAFGLHGRYTLVPTDLERSPGAFTAALVVTFFFE